MPLSRIIAAPSLTLCRLKNTTGCLKKTMVPAVSSGTRFSSNYEALFQEKALECDTLRSALKNFRVEQLKLNDRVTVLEQDRTNIGAMFAMCAGLLPFYMQIKSLRKRELELKNHH